MGLLMLGRAAIVGLALMLLVSTVSAVPVLDFSNGDVNSVGLSGTFGTPVVTLTGI